MALVILSLVIVVLLVDRHLAARDLKSERAAATAERAALTEQATDERRELLTRVQHPKLIVTPKQQAPTETVAPEADEWNDVGVVMPLVETDDEPVEAPA